MFVTNHVLAGGLIGFTLRRRPATAFAAGVVSHLAMDAIPHYGCPPGRFMTVARRDGLTGLAVMAAVSATTDPPVLPVVAGMAGAALLDMDKPFQLVFDRKPWPGFVNRFHAGIQDESPTRLGKELVIGAALIAGMSALIAADRRCNRNKRTAA